MDDRVWMYHETEAPEGRIFNVKNRKEADDLDADGWVDSPDKFGKKKAPKAGTGNAGSGDDPKPIAKMDVAELEDYIVQRGGVPEGNKAAKVKLALSLPTEPAKTAPADVEDAEDGDGVNQKHDDDEAVVAETDAPKPVDQMSAEELRAELDEAEVTYAEDASVDNLKAGVKALRGE